MDQFPVSVEIKVRFSDCDLLGHMNNATFLTYMEQARIEYLKHLKGFHFSNQSKLSAIIAEITCTYKSPAHFDEIINVEIRISEIKRSSFVMEYQMTEKKTHRLVATARSVAVLFDYQSQKSVAFPDDLKAQIEKIEGKNF